MVSRLHHIWRLILNTHAARTLGATFFGLSLLLLILIISGIGTFYPYETALEKIYNTPWFFALLMLLCINHAISALLTLVFQTLPMYHPRYRHRTEAYHSLKHKFELRISGGDDDATHGPKMISRLIEYLADRNYTVHRRENLIYGHKNLWGRFGGTITHVGLVIVIIGGMVQITAGLSGQIQLLEGEADGRIVYERGGRQVVRHLGFDLYLRDFDIGFYPNTQMPQRFISHIEVRDAANNGLARGVAEVNNAFFFGGYTFHQNSYNEIGDVPRYHVVLANEATAERHTFQVTMQPSPMPSFYHLPESSRVFALRETRDGLLWYLADGGSLIAKGLADRRAGGFTLAVTRFTPDFRILEDGGINLTGEAFDNPAVEIALRSGERTVATQWLFLNPQLQDFVRATGGPFRFELDDLLMAREAAGRTQFTPDDVKAIVKIFDAASGSPLGQFEIGGGRSAVLNVAASEDLIDLSTADNKGWYVERAEPVKAYVSILGVTNAPGKPIAYIGCVFLVLGMIIGFGIPRRQIWALYRDEDQVLLVGARTRYYGARLRQELLDCYHHLSKIKDTTNTRGGDSMPRIHAGIKLIAAGLVGATLMAFAAPTARAADAGIDYTELATLPVHHMGMLKSFYTFAHEEVKTITGRASYKDHEPMAMALSLLWSPETWMDEPMIKVENKELRDLLGGKMVSPRQCFDPAKSAKLQEMFNSDENLKKAINVLFYQANSAMDLAHSWRVIPLRTATGELTYSSPHEFTEHKGDVTVRQQAIFAAAQGMETAWRAEDAAAFNTHVSDLKRLLDEELAAQGVNPKIVRMDYYYTMIHPFARAGNVYLASLLLFGAGLFASRPQFYRLATVALALGLVVNVAAMVMRGYVAGRLPVSNFYESFTFAIAGVVLFSLVFQTIFSKPLIGAIGAGIGFVFMGVANSLPVRMLAIEPLIPALQSYWLNIHVTTMLLSYAIFAISFVVGLIYVARHIKAYGFRFRVPAMLDATGLNIKAGESPQSVEPADAGPIQALVTLDMLNFRLIAVGLAMLTTGIILGAVWADTAWGRPWGWDPKETWAAISWGVYAVFAHLHLFGKWRGLPAVVVSILGFLCVVFTYVGVSFFLSGLHSYA